MLSGEFTDLGGCVYTGNTAVRGGALLLESSQTAITDSQIDFVANAVAASLETIYPKAKMRA